MKATGRWSPQAKQEKKREEKMILEINGKKVDYYDLTWKEKQDLWDEDHPVTDYFLRQLGVTEEDCDEMNLSPGEMEYLMWMNDGDLG